MKHRKKTPPGYVSWWVKKNGGKRQVFAPNPETMVFLKEFLKESPEQKTAMQLDCVEAHIGSQYFMRIDLAKAFDHIRREDIVPLAVDNGLPFRAIEQNAGPFFHENGGLIQGSPYSPYLFELYCRNHLDPKLIVYCEKWGLVFTRYMDDIVISSLEKFGPRRRKSIRRIIGKTCFSINERKTKCIDSHAKPVIFLGVSIYKGMVDTKPGYKHEIAASSGASREGKIKYRKAVLALNAN